MCRRIAGRERLDRGLVDRVGMPLLNVLPTDAVDAQRAVELTTTTDTALQQRCASTHEREARDAVTRETGDDQAQSDD